MFRQKASKFIMVIVHSAEPSAMFELRVNYGACPAAHGTYLSVCDLIFKRKKF